LTCKTRLPLSFCILCWRGHKTLLNQPTNDTLPSRVVLVKALTHLCSVSVAMIFSRVVLCDCVQLMGDEPDLDPEITSDFFQNYVLKFDPTLLTESGMK